MAIHFPQRYDAVIVGARVAGAATALLLARAGARVLVIDRGRYGTDTLSTHVLMRGAVVQLSRWQLLAGIEAAGTPPIRSTSFHYDQEIVRIAIRPKYGVDCLFAPRRHLLDRLLVDAAIVAGADVRYGLTLESIRRAPHGRVTGMVAHDEDRRLLEVDAGIVIGADGLRSMSSQLLNAAVIRRGAHAAATVYGYWPDLPVEGFAWHWSRGVAAGVIPTNENETCVFVSIPAERFADAFQHDLRAGYHRALRQAAPAIAGEIGWSRASPRLRGFGGHPGFVRQSWGPGWALVGDAGYFKDPITAHGITDALRDAELLACAVVSGGLDALAQYQTISDRLSCGIFELSDDIASFNWDADRLRGLHHRLSEEMTREVEAITEAARPCETYA